MMGRQRHGERQDDENAAQQDRATDATRHTTPSRHDERARGLCNQINRATEVCDMQQPAGTTR
jgi:hypothetical protein